MADPAQPEQAPVASPPQPGTTITPAGAPRSVEDRLTAIEAPRVPQPVASAPAPVATPSPVQQQVPPPTPSVLTPPQSLQNEQPQHVGQLAVAAQESALPSEDEGDNISWTASEFIAHEKAPTWYGSLAVVTVIGAAFIYLLTKDLISSIVAIVCGITFGFYAGRQPKQIRYVLTPHGIGIGERFIPYHELRSFTVVPDGAFLSILFYPLKRFSTLTTIYFAPEQEDRIVGLLASTLPYEDHQPDPVDRLMRKIRF